MMLRSRPVLCLLAMGVSLVSCRGPLPNEADLDRAYVQAQNLAKRDIAELDQQRARGEITPEEYVRMKQAINERTTARANEIVLTQHALVQSKRQSVGLPTPENPQDIGVPQAGTLATGVARKAFNDSGGADGTGGGLGFLPGGSIGLGQQGYVGGPAAPTTAVASAAPTVISAPPPRAAPTPGGGLGTSTRPAGGSGGGGGGPRP
ncbi:MAG: hypothetical protein JWO89_3139 [Verrucomicrobiaceae bacterium]|nr:hypothetical protein [Verrucomicrobiaceae bacterium]